MRELDNKVETESVWVTCFDSSGLIANVYVTSGEYATTSAKYYRGHYPSVKILNEEEFNKASDADLGMKVGNKYYA